MDEKRDKYRSVVRVPFNVSHDSFGSVTVHSRDLSVGGIFAVHEAGLNVPPVGSILDVQVAGVNGYGGDIQAEVVRIENEGEGFGLKFLHVEYEDTEEA